MDGGPIVAAAECIIIFHPIPSLAAYLTIYDRWPRASQHEHE
jgi:hypothetical protein